MAIEKLNINS